METKQLAKNTIWLMLMNIAKVLFPFAVVPFLARALSPVIYGQYQYIRALMTFVIVIIDYGFIYSGTTKIVNNNGDATKDSQVTSELTVTKSWLALFSLILVLIVYFATDIIRGQLFFVLLLFISVAITSLLPDYLFRGRQKMNVIAKRFILSKLISTVLIILLVKSDTQLILIGWLEVLSSLLALVITTVAMRKLGVTFRPRHRRTSVVHHLNEGRHFFFASIAPMLYGSLNTLIIGWVLHAEGTAYWSVALNVITAVLSLYIPIANGLYPHMAQHKDLHLLHKYMKLFMPLVMLGAAILYFGSDWIIVLLGGSQYAKHGYLLRYLAPTVVFAFPGILYGFSGLGVIHRSKELFLSVLTGAVFHILGLFSLYVSGQFSLVSVCILRSCTEGLNLIIKIYFIGKFKHEFSK